MKIDENCSLSDDAKKGFKTKIFSHNILRVFLILFFSCSIFTHNFASEIETPILEINEETPIAISIGGMCYVALALKHYGIRKEAYPFDWVISPTASLIKVINEDFLNYFSPEYIAGVTNVYTGIAFVHDFPNSLKEAYYPEADLEKNYSSEKESELQWNYEKYNRRINRFIAVLSSDKPVVLIRSEATREEALLIRDLFRFKYPLLNLKLVVINHNLEVHGGVWNEEGILNYYLPTERNVDYNGPEWKQIVKDTNLIKDPI
ncbi:MAG: hypothetical protein H0X29_05240 [Parachlamydiaceae bacterium]|nr:hypothetical protein [Parachlamydiaceae bacterium]